ncbi:hypothetical protein [Halostella pelagica]|uniref:hypothetical protein n=1 Tax=Halostella pelagica TaxID=2583824 RepID=UPI00108076DD|nr:hypothetical protein [Halostella pelagica]
MPSAFSRRQFLATAAAVGLVGSPAAADDGSCVGQDVADGVVWQRTYGEDESLKVTDAVAHGDGFALAGIDRDAGTSGRSWLRRVDGDGREQWRREYGDDERRSVTSVAVTADDGFLLAGTAGEGRAEQFVTKTAADGGEAWTTTVDVSGRDTFAAELDDGSVVLCVATPSPEPTYPHLTLLDSAGEVSESRTFDDRDGRQIRAEVVADDGVVLAGTRDSDEAEGWLWHVTVGDGIEIDRSAEFERKIIAADRFDEGGLVLAGTNSTWLAQLGPEWEVEWEQTEFEPDPHIKDVSSVPGGVAACGYHWGEGCARPPWAFRANDDGTTWHASVDDSPRLKWESVLPANEGDRVVVAGSDYGGDGSSATLALVEAPESSGEESTTTESNRTTTAGGTTNTNGTTAGPNRTTASGTSTDGTTEETPTTDDDTGTAAGELDGFGIGAGIAALTAALGYRTQRSRDDD